MKFKALAVALAISLTGAAVAPTAVIAAPNTTKTITIKKVKKNATAVSCWSVVNGKVYNLTGWINKHPGGASRIIAMCGKDATRAFTQQHMGNTRVATELAPFQIGILKKKKKA
ncbi:MAG: cytochrome b5-like heme/steroid binding domain-containing protein [Candidatus Nanopelagicales bacterium]